MTSPTQRSWGPILLPDGRVRFRLWAPAEPAVTLLADAKEIAMQAGPDGWHEIETDRVKPGEAYAFRLSDGMDIPDPAARAQLRDVDGPSLLLDPDTYSWQNPGWKGRPWEEAVIYELHIGAFTPEGTFRAAIDRLPDLAHAGVTVIELMPVAHFSGRRGWGYDGVLHFAPHNAYLRAVNLSCPSNQRWPLRVNQSMETCHEILCSLPQASPLFEHRDGSRASAPCQHDAGADRRNGRRPLRHARLRSDRLTQANRSIARLPRKAGFRLNPVTS